jgi:hypothetical protein
LCSYSLPALADLASVLPSASFLPSASLVAPVFLSRLSALVADVSPFDVVSLAVASPLSAVLSASVLASPPLLAAVSFVVDASALVPVVSALAPAASASAPAGSAAAVDASLPVALLASAPEGVVAVTDFFDAVVTESVDSVTVAAAVNIYVGPAPAEFASPFSGDAADSVARQSGRVMWQRPLSVAIWVVAFAV